MSTMNPADLKMDGTSLYREDVYTDRKIGTIRPGPAWAACCRTTALLIRFLSDRPKPKPRMIREPGRGCQATPALSIALSPGDSP